jgi:D-aspartate ligase
MSGPPDGTVPVVVLTAARDPLLTGSVGIIRSLGRMGVPVHAVHRDRWAPPLFSRYLSGRFLAPIDEAEPQRSVAALLDIGQRVGARPILIPVDDVGTLLVDAHAGTLRQAFRFPERPAGLARRLANKRQLHELCRELDVPTAATAFPASQVDVERFLAQARFPVVAKAIDPVLLQRRPRARSVVIANRPDELREALERTAVDGDPNLMLQEYIPGGAESIWMFNGYFDAESECLLSFTGTKLRQFLPATGTTSLGICVANPVVDQTTRRLLTSIGYRGIVDLGYRFDRRDGRFKLLDVNPRIGATFRLFVGDDGTDVVRALYLDMTGQPVPASGLRTGRKWVVENYDLVSSFLDRRAGRLTVPDWLRSLRGIEETAWFAADDPAPFAMMCWRTAAGGVRHALAPKTTGSTGGSAQDGRDGGGPQRRVDAYFARDAAFWRDVYRRGDVFALIHQRRQAMVLDRVGRLGLPPEARILDIGTGAGLTAVQLARRGFDLEAIDTTAAMIELAGRHALEHGVAGRVRRSLADAHTLPFRGGSFDLVLAIGVIPWLHAPDQAISEMARILRPGGHLLVTADNRGRLSHLVDPRYNPALEPARQWLKDTLVAAGLRQPSTDARPRTHWIRQVNRLLGSSGLRLAWACTYGFGPFTLLGRKALPDRMEIKLHHALQQLADSRMPGMRSAGAQYLVLASKPGPTQAVPAPSRKDRE